MQRELQLWQFISERLKRGENVMLLVVAESSGSSPGRAGYKMAVASDGELTGSIGGGLMEMNLVEESRRLLAVPPALAGGFREQVHRDNYANASGMICSGKQTVVNVRLSANDLPAITRVVTGLLRRESPAIEIMQTGFVARQNPPAHADGTDLIASPNRSFRVSDSDFVYTETIAFQNHLYIIGGGHCALALSELISKMDFHISIFDDRPDLNTIQKNSFAHVIKIVDTYERISDHIPSGECAYAVVMTLGYRSDQIVVRSLISKEFKYFGVLGSKAKMSAMFKSLRQEGIPDSLLDRIRTPVGLPINSRTPEEIAVSIAAEIISVKNG